MCSLFSNLPFFSCFKYINTNVTFGFGNFSFCHLFRNQFYSQKCELHANSLPDGVSSGFSVFLNAFIRVMVVP